MRCDRCEDIVSAMVDGEASTIEIEAAEQHLRRCRPCAAHRTAVEALARLTRAPSRRPHDLSAAILTQLRWSQGVRRIPRGERRPGQEG